MQRDALGCYLNFVKLENNSEKDLENLNCIFDLVIEELKEKKESRLFTLASGQLLDFFKISYDPTNFQWTSKEQYQKLPLNHCRIIIHAVKERLNNKDCEKYLNSLLTDKYTEIDCGEISLKVKESNGQEDSNIEVIKEIRNCLESIDQNLECNQSNEKEEYTQKTNVNNEQKRENYIQTFQQAKQMVEDINTSFAKMQEKIVELNRIFYSFGQSSIFSELTMLYDLINDIELSQIKALENGEAVDMKNNIENLSVFRSVMLNVFAAAGVDVIISEPGTLINGKIHEVLGNSDFDPRTTVIQKSLKAGFKLGETVLRKERVSVR